MDGEAELSVEIPTIKTSAPDFLHKHLLLTQSSSSSPYSSPLISPPSSAFVSALQSPYISPRATTVVADTTEETPTPATTLTHPSPPVSYCGSQSDDIPSTSYTPPPERQDCFSDEPSKQKLKTVTCIPVSGQEMAPRISFTFPMPRISFAKCSVSPASSNAKLRSCDVYIGFNGQNPNLVRFCKWLKSELELQGIACFVADRAQYADNQSHEIADRVICSVAFGVVLVTRYSLANHRTVEEIRFFAQKKNLIPLFFDTDANEISRLFEQNKDCICNEALDSLARFQELSLEAIDGNWRSCVTKAAGILKAKLGRNCAVEKEIDGNEELPFPRNNFFVGREKEMMDIEAALFGYQEKAVGAQKKYIDLEVGRCKEPNLEAWIDPAIDRSIHKYKSKNGKSQSYCSITGSPGVGKTELALEFAYRYSQRYKMVFWVGGESRYLRQNIMTMSVNMGLDVSAADEDKEPGRIRSFDEQESEALKRVKRELFRDMPYLLIIDNLESEREWWEGKDLHELLPRNTGATHVIITTQLPKVMNFDTVQIQTLPFSDAMMLIRGRQRKKESMDDAEVEFLGKFDEKLGSSSLGLCVMASLLSELCIAPSALFEALNHFKSDELNCTSSLSHAEQQFCRTSPFLMKLLSFCDAVLCQGKGNSNNILASRMLQAGAWFAPVPIPANLLASAAHFVPSSTTTTTKLKKWTECFLSNQTWKKNEEDSALLLVRLGLARNVNRPGCWIQFHPITQIYARWKYGLAATNATIQGIRKAGNPVAAASPEHLWAAAFLLFGFKSEPPLVQLKAMDMVFFIKKTYIPLAVQAFTTFSRCKAALELLNVCTNVLDEVEKSFVSRIQDLSHGSSLCWKKTLQSNQRMDEHVWQEVTLLKATLLEMRAKLLLRGGHFDSGEELCRTCISIRTVMLGHNHSLTLSAQETLARLVRMRSKIS